MGSKNAIEREGLRIRQEKVIGHREETVEENAAHMVKPWNLKFSNHAIPIKEKQKKRN